MRRTFFRYYKMIVIIKKESVFWMQSLNCRYANNESTHTIKTCFRRTLISDSSKSHRKNYVNIAQRRKSTKRKSNFSGVVVGKSRF